VLQKPDISAQTLAQWRRAARDGAVSAELEAIYAMLADQIAARGPACWASGRCCNFDAAGHRLYVTGLEAAYAMTRPESTLTEAEIEAARAGGGCPFQRENLCGIHAIKPMGCRVYFCDASAQQWQHDLSERMLGMIRGLHERHGIEYVYAEWRGLLAVLV
jgi:Fe-S-cluster containining protein